MIWKHIPGLDTNIRRYEASSCGQIRSIVKKTGKTRILSPNLQSGYHSVKIGDMKRRVHMLVALAHLEKPPEADDTWTVDHVISNQTTNNDISNLRWASKKMQKNNQEKSTRVMIEYESSYDAERKLGILSSTVRSRVKSSSFPDYNYS